MAFTSMHFAMGMIGSGAIATAACLSIRRGFRWIPATMTIGGLWAVIPDLPRIWREDFPSLPLSSLLGSKYLEDQLHVVGDLFFLHRALDRQPHEYTLLGLGLIILMYSLSTALLMYLEHRQRNSIGNRAWRAHTRRSSHREGNPSGKKRRSRSRRSGHGHRPHPESIPALNTDNVVATPSDDGVIAGRIRSSHLSRSGS